MCGIAGYYARSALDAELRSSVSTILHRGPDFNQTRSLSAHDGWNVGLGHARLSIIGLDEAGNQPMVSACGRYTMVFNGEIYNYPELKKQLQQVPFKGSSDSEVLLEYFTRNGMKGLADLRGIFAAAIYDEATASLYLIRDQLGVKPLYYHMDAHGIRFSSEVRGLRELISDPLVPSRADLFDFLNCGFVYEPRTGYEGVLKVPAGACLVYREGEVEISAFFDLDSETRGRGYDESLLKQAVESQLVSDVDLGVFFSGGIDSTVVSLFANQKENLFVRYDEEEIRQSGAVDDWPFVAKIAETLGLDVSSVTFDVSSNNAEEVLDSMREVARGTEEMISDYTYFASAKICEEARRRGYKVMLSGMGGDEVFIGYPRYKLLIESRKYALFAKLIRFDWVAGILKRFKSIEKKVDRFREYFASTGFVDRYSRLLGFFSREEMSRLLGKEAYDLERVRYEERVNAHLKGFEDEPDIIKALVLDRYGFLSHNLTVADKSSMSVGLEMRVPLLDQTLYCAALSAFRSGAGSLSHGKGLLKSVLYKHIRKSLIDRPKTGFNPPLDDKVSAVGKETVKSLIDSSGITRYLNASEMNRIVDCHFAGEENNTYKVWQLIYLALWLDENTGQYQSPV